MQSMQSRSWAISRQTPTIVASCALLILSSLIVGGCARITLVSRIDTLATACDESVPHDAAMNDRICDDAAAAVLGLHALPANGERPL